MSLTLGEKLRQAREARGISISEVAENTRISALYLESIENNDYRTLPGGIFNKGFVKSYARYLGLNDQEALQEYAALISEQGSDVNDDPKTYRPQVLTDERSRSGLLPTVIFSVIIVGLMVWGIMAFLQYFKNNPSQPVADANVNRIDNANAQLPATPMPTPVVNDIKVEFKALRDPISLTYWADGKQTIKTVTSKEPLSFTAQQNAKLRYYRGFTQDKLDLTVNGKKITAPNPPAKGVAIEFEFTKQNLEQILQAGAVTLNTTPATVASPTPRP